MFRSLLLVATALSLADAFNVANIVSRRSACALAGAAALQTCLPLQAALAANVDKEKALLRDTSAKLKALQDNKDAFIADLAAGGEAGENAAKMLPAAIPFKTFQKLEGVSDPEFMEAAIDYAEANRGAKDLIKLAKLTTQEVEVSLKEKGKPRETKTMKYGEAPDSGLGSTKEYAERAVQEALGASVALEAAIKFMGN